MWSGNKPKYTRTVADIVVGSVVIVPRKHAHTKKTAATLTV